MKLSTVSLLSFCLIAGCGGASKEGDRSNDTVRGDEDDDADDDESSSSDDDADDDARGDDDGDDDDPVGDDTSDDDGPDITPRPDPGMVDPTPPGTGSPGVVPVPAEGCTTVGQSKSTTSCDIRESCSNAYRYTWCSQLPDGAWSCQCSDGFVGHDLEVTSDEAPCEMVKETCGSIETPEFSGELSCDSDYKSSSVDYCEMRDRCTDAVPVTDDIAVVQTVYESTSCYDIGNGSLQCSCSGLEGSKSFTLSGIAATDACTTAGMFCDGEDAPEPVGEETCTLNNESVGANYCQRQQTCSQTLDVDGVEAELTETQVGSCSTDANGLTTCSCYGSSKSYSFQSDTPASDAAACATAIDVCNASEAPVPEGPIDCALNNQSASTTSCNAYVQCTQDAKVGDVTIGMYGNISVYCSPNGDTWSCQCVSGNQSKVLELESVDAWSACTDAAELCPDEVEVQVGSNGSPCYGYPVPPPSMTPGGRAEVADVAVAPAPGQPVVPCLF